jgi:hypothetical protein
MAGRLGLVLLRASQDIADGDEIFRQSEGDTPFDKKSTTPTEIGFTCFKENGLCEIFSNAAKWV